MNPNNKGGLFDALLSRQMASTRVPSVPPNPQNRVPPAAQRWATANAMQQAYANNWNPNPMLLQALMHAK